MIVDANHSHQKLCGETPAGYKPHIIYVMSCDHDADDDVAQVHSTQGAREQRA